jgi:hypothetical protein
LNDKKNNVKKIPFYNFNDSAVSHFDGSFKFGNSNLKNVNIKNKKNLKNNVINNKTI